jgi:glycosyltransferase involved in cell wall biosynthesis
MASRSAHSLLVTTEHNTSNRRRGWGWYAPVDRWMYGRYDRIVCVGEETERALNAYIPSTGRKTVVVHNGIDRGRIRDAAPSEDVRDIEGFRILMVAAFRAQKDHATLIRAMRSLPERYTLLLAGGAETREDERTMRECVALSESLGLRDRVRFLGVRHDVPGLMAASDVIVLSSHYEGNPLSALEAMSSGKPVIASDVPGLSPVVGGAGLLFPCGEGEILAGLIRSVCEDDAEAAGVAEACRLRSEEYDIDRTARSYMEVYSELFNNNPICSRV